MISCGDDQGLIVWDQYSPRMLSANIIKKAKMNGVRIISEAESEVKFVTFGT